MSIPSLHIALQDFKTHGHHAKYAYRQAVELAGQGARVSLIIPSAFPLEEMSEAYGGDDNVNVYRLDAVTPRSPLSHGRSIASEFKNLQGVLKLCADLQVDVLHLIDFQQLYRGLAAASFLGCLSKPQLPTIVGTLHRTQLWDDDYWQSRPLGRLRQRCRQALFSHSIRSGLYTCFVHPSCVGMLPANELRMTPLEHPVDIPSYPIDKQVARSTLGLSLSETYLLLFGIMHREKGLDLALGGLSMLPSVKLVVAGAAANDMTASNVLQQIQSSGLADKCIVHLGFVPEEKVSLYFAASDVVLLPYSTAFKALSGSTLLAAAYRRPVVATDVGGNGHTVRRYGLGIVVPPAEPERLAQAIETVLAWNNTHRSRFVSAAETFSKAASWRATTSQLLAVYQKARSKTLACTQADCLA